jgi:hypothetical protein
MKIIWSFILPATTLLFACNSGKTGEQQGAATSAAGDFTPATPAGKVTVAFPSDADTSRISIHFEADGKSNDKTFVLPLARDVAEQDLYRVVWDKPSSAYIGVLKSDHTTRYYHASIDNGDAKINQVGTPPAAVWHYAEDKEGLGTVSLDLKPVDNYTQELTSGKIIAELIVKKLPTSSPDSVKMYAEFGGANKTIELAVPAEATTGIVSSTSYPHQAFLVQVLNKRYTNLVEIKVEDGHLQVNKLR